MSSWARVVHSKRIGNRYRLAWVAAACLCLEPLLAQRTNVPDAMTNPFAADSSAAAAGKVLYQQTCQSCHGGEARGDRGPALATGNFRHGGQDTDLFQTIRTGIPGTQMPAFATLPADNVWRIISYLRSLNPNTVTANEIVPGDAVTGKRIFFGAGGCSACHGVNAVGGIVGPDLSSIGTNSAEQLRSVIFNPNDPVSRPAHAPAPETVVARTRAGHEVRGVKVADDGYTLIVTDLSGTRHRFQTQDLLERRDERMSVMPSDYGHRLYPSEIQDLVAYLKTLKSRDLSKTIQAELPVGLTSERLRHAEKEPQNWLSYWGDYQGRHFSGLQQITPANVNRLQARWSVQIPGNSLLESTPVVVDGTMYTSGIPGQVFAIDAQSGLQLWNYERRQKTVNPYETNAFNRGVAVLGSRVFVGTLDAALVALDARTGLVLWETQVADTLAGYSITSAPLAVGDKIIVGVAGGEFGIRGFIDAYDAATGKRLWRFNTIPGPREFGNETWRGDTWKHGSGGAWLTGSYDPDLDTLYWTVGNPGPDLNADIREGDNLFTCSVLALDPATGTRKWHYQFTPGDSHDWDANEDVILADLTVGGVKRKVLVQADRNGMFYVLDRTNGKFLFAKPYVKQTWNSGFDAEGRPLLVPGWKSSSAGSVVYPNLGGGTNWQSPSYDPARAMLYVVARDSGMNFRSTAAKYEEGRQYMGGSALGAGGTDKNGVLAIDVRSGAIRWESPLARRSLSAGVLGTGSGVVFVAGGDGDLIALHGDSGKSLWHFKTGGTIAASPISYAIDGEQYVTIAAGNVLYTFALPEEGR